MRTRSLKSVQPFAIGVFEDDDEFLHFPKEEEEDESIEVDEVQLKSGRELSDPYHQSKQPNGKNVTPSSSEVAGHVSNGSVKYDVIAHLKKILAMLSVYDALCLSSDLRKAFIMALSFREDYRFEVSQAEIEQTKDKYMTFNDEDLLLGHKKA